MNGSLSTTPNCRRHQRHFFTGFIAPSALLCDGAVETRLRRLVASDRVSAFELIEAAEITRLIGRYLADHARDVFRSVTALLTTTMIRHPTEPRKFGCRTDASCEYAICLAYRGRGHTVRVLRVPRVIEARTTDDTREPMLLDSDSRRNFPQDFGVQFGDADQCQGPSAGLASSLLPLLQRSL